MGTYYVESETWTKPGLSAGLSRKATQNRLERKLGGHRGGSGGKCRMECPGGGSGMETGKDAADFSTGGAGR